MYQESAPLSNPLRFRATCSTLLRRTPAAVLVSILSWPPSSVGDAGGCHPAAGTGEEKDSFEISIGQ